MSHVQNQKLPPSQALNLQDLPIDPRDTNLRWIFLFFCCMLTFGSYFGLEAPNNLQLHIENYFQITTTEYNAFASLFYIPCMFMPLIGGILSAKIGISKGLIIFGASIMIGLFLMAIGVSQKSFNLMMIGRFMHGSGHDALLVLKKVLLSQWFLNKELSLSIGLGLCVSRLGSSLSGYASPRMYLSDNNLSTPFYWASILGFVSFICVIVVILIDDYARKQINKLEYSAEKKQKFKLADLKEMSLIHFALIFTFCFLYPPFFAYLTNNSASLNIRFGFSFKDAALCNSVIYTLATILTPIVGYLSDRFSIQSHLLVASGFLQFGGHLILIILPDTTTVNYGVFAPLLMMGMFYACFSSAFWPSLTIVTDEKIRASVFGIAYAGLNTIITLILLVNGKVKDSTKEYSGGYLWTEVLMAVVTALGCVMLVKMRKLSHEEILQGKKNDGLLLVQNQDKGNYEMSTIKQNHQIL